MRRIFMFLMFIVSILLWTVDSTEARGGFGGGRGGFGGGHSGFGGSEFRGGGSEFGGHLGGEYRRERIREPESRQMERRSKPASEIRQGRGKQFDRDLPMEVQSKPTKDNLQKFLNLPPESQKGLSDLGKIGAGAAAGAIGAIGAQHLMERPGSGDRIGSGDRPARMNRDLSRDGQPDKLPARDKINADQVRNNIQNRYDNLFTPQWWAAHPNLAHQYWENMGRYQYAWNHWWRPAAWGALAGWIAGSAWASPQYYDYSSGIYYEGDNVYSNDTPVASAPEYYNQASKIATPADSPTQADEELMPLGVFALTQVGTSSSNTLLQLAVDKQGIIKGTYYNTGTDTTRPVKGSVDRQTQRAAWSFADGKDSDIVMETGIYNLTLDQTEALVHFGPNKTQRWLMVRMEQPQKEKDKAAQN